MKSCVAVLSLCAVLGFGGSVSAGAEELKIGVFDMQKIMRDSKKIAAYREKFGVAMEEKRKQFEAKQAAVRQGEDALASESASLSAKDRKTLEDRHAAEVRELKRMRDDVDAELQKMDRALTQQVFVDLTSVVTAVGEKEGYDLVFEKTASGVAYTRAKLDMTDKVIAVYDSSEIPAGKGK